jgi:hypothetical protein
MQTFSEEVAIPLNTSGVDAGVWLVGLGTNESQLCLGDASFTLAGARKGVCVSALTGLSIVFNCQSNSRGKNNFIIKIIIKILLNMFDVVIKFGILYSHFVSVWKNLY